MVPLNIAIVGAGIGGPAAAVGLARNGHNVTLYERATSIGSVGFAFRVTPNSDRCLKFLGIDALAGGAVAADLCRMMTSKGELLGEFRENQNPEGLNGGLSVFAHRPALQKQLIDEARRWGAQIKTGVEVTSVDVPCCTITFADGSTSTVDLIIAADGVNSCIRPEIIDSGLYPLKTSTGHNCLRATLPLRAILGDPTTSGAINDELRLLSWHGDDKIIIGYVVDHGRLFNIVCAHSEELSNGETSSGDDAENTGSEHRISLDKAREIYKDFDNVAVRLIELADPGSFRVWKLMDMDDIPRWSADRVVLLGDACHPLVPFGFSGASMAIEDAVTLTELLLSDVNLEQVQGRLQLYERIRKPRVAKVRDQSRLVASNFKQPGGFKAFREFLDNHDAAEYAKQELKKQVHAPPAVVVNDAH
ncbi:hypothetical protein M434DRAFT_31786 [Hypoxylon sp. CO27-5]|nr:hypothetical protein M434DRAFT_31786 [Hypoxylon sp. CO27-5]